MTRWIAALVVVASGTAGANERHFGFTYESAVLPKSDREVEFWVTPRLGRLDYYSRFDTRMEIEVGLTDRLMMAFYLNGVARSVREGEGVATTFEFDGVSSEWKYKLLDPVADPIGLSIYGELTASTHEVELEAKVILDKRLGPFLLAANLVGEEELGFELDGIARENAIEADLAAGYSLTERLTLALELRSRTVSAPGVGVAYSALYGGPTLAYASDNWWASISFQPQLPALAGADSGLLVLDDQERFNLRLLFSIKI